MRERLRGATGVGQVALHGALDQVGLATVLAILEMERRSGVIGLRRGRKQTGRLLLREGAVVSAVLGARTGRDAAYEMLGWEEGEFAFQPMPVDVADQVQCSTTHLLLDAAQRRDELAA